MTKKIEMPKLNKIKAHQVECIRKQTSRYVFVYDKEGHGVCERCNSNIVLSGKHNSKTVCPVCKTPMTICHTWRRSPEERIDWVVIPQLVSENILALRYVVAYREGILIKFIEERARMVMDFNKAKEYCYELKWTSNWVEFQNQNGKTREWQRSTRDYFRERGMGYGYRRWCCLQAEEYRGKTFFDELAKIDCLRFLNLKDMWTYNMYVSGCLGTFYQNRDIYEKLQKVGMTRLIKEDMNSYTDRMHINPKEKSLHKILGITHGDYKQLLTHQSLNVLEVMRSYPNLKEDLLDVIYKHGVNKYNLDNLSKYHVVNAATVKYVCENKLNFNEYEHYLYLLRELEYPKEKYYLYPKDFAEADIKLSNEYKEKKDAIQKKKDDAASSTIKKISEALYNMPGLQEFFDGTRGLLVKVPTSSDEIKREGIVQHNCVGTYCLRVADQETMVFFVRKIDEPDTPWITMEYNNGRIVQIRYAHNLLVQENNIIQFSNAFANALKANNYLAG